MSLTCSMIHSSVVRGDPQVEAVPHVEPREIGPDADLPAPEQGDGKKIEKIRRSRPLPRWTARRASYGPPSRPRYFVSTHGRRVGGRSHQEKRTPRLMAWLSVPVAISPS